MDVIDRLDLDLFSIGVPKIREVWPGAQLEIVPLDNVPKTPQTLSRIPISPKEPENIIKTINPEITGLNWEVIKLEENHDIRCATIIVNQWR